MDDSFNSTAVPAAFLQQYRAQGWSRHLRVNASTTQGQSPALFLPYNERNLNADGGVVHGGVIATLLHDAALLAALPLAQTPEKTHVVDIQVSYLRAARGVDLTATARVERCGRTFSFLRAEACDPEGRKVATAEVVCAMADVAHDAEVLPGMPTLAALKGEAVARHAFGEMMNANLAKRLPGMTVSVLEAGKCVLEVAEEDWFQGRQGFLSPGVQLLAADNVGVFASFALVKQPGKASTVDLKMTFCQPLGDEPAVAIGESVSRKGPLVFNRHWVFGAESGRLGAFGTMTFLS